MKKFLIVCMMASLCLAAQEKLPLNPSVNKKIESYLNGIETLQARIIQTGPNGQKKEGFLKIWRPKKGDKKFGCLRLEYPKDQTLIIANGEVLSETNKKTGDFGFYEIKQTPASLILQRKIEFSKKGGIKVLGSQEQEKGFVIALTRPGEENNFRLDLFFERHPIFRLKAWSVRDPQGNQTMVELENIQIGINPNPSDFEIKNP